MEISSFDDPDYIVQGCYRDGYMCQSTGSDNETEAIRLGVKMLKDPCFEGDYVSIMTRDGELVADSRENRTAFE